jgi:Domain of unknown function (DUF5710)
MSTVRLYLAPVPAEQRRTVQLLGARWDSRERRFWMDPAWPNAGAFTRWLPQDTVRAMLS